ncbi:hypothetical protein [Acrocarpospora sp. B8E8]|uniref:hypothetical protein n=1 Tax=Acrocarpospora sp. B8E8 TaxID=3153572 RepID=UPI00325C922D
MGALRHRPRLPIPDHATEADRATWALAYLGQWFQVEREVWGSHCSGRRVRLDAILRPRDSSSWKDEDPAFGVEFKLAHSGSTRDFTAWAAQAVDYTHVYWHGYGRLRIFTCPSPFVVLAERDGGDLMARMLGQLGVGELSPIQRRGWSLLLNDHVVWCESDGPVAAKQWSIKSKVGSR